jgi:hypothetical protein
MKNYERQASLDKKMWEESENYYDMHGYMIMCEFCEYEDTCKSGEYDYDFISRNCICAKAWNRMKRG